VPAFGASVGTCGSARKPLAALGHYGAMLMESFVAVMAMTAASILDPGLYFAKNAPAGPRRWPGRHGHAHR
jgi:carbon starvation protein CstA